MDTLRLLAVLTILYLATTVKATPTNTNLALIYHPLSAGTTWVYEVNEGDNTYTQRITVVEGETPTTFIMITSSMMRKTSYYVSVNGNKILLHKVDARLSILPFKLTKHFDPPLTFLNVSDNFSAEWSWTGRTTGHGSNLISVDYTMMLAQNVWKKILPPHIDVTATITYNDGSEDYFIARYLAGVGLTDLRSDNYRKSLIKYYTPSTEVAGPIKSKLDTMLPQ